MPPASPTESDGYCTNIGKRSGEDVTVSFKPRLTLRAQRFSWRAVKEHNQSCINFPGTNRRGRGICPPTDDQTLWEGVSSCYFHPHTSPKHRKSQRSDRIPLGTPP